MSNMKTIKGPGIFLAQFADDKAPFNSIDSICQWAAALGYTGIQIPTWDTRLINLELLAESRTHAEEYQGRIAEYGLSITELSTHLQGQLIAVHPAYDQMFDGFAPEPLRGKPAARTQWAEQQLHMAAKASQHLGLTAHASFSGALMWHTVYPWPQRPAGLVTQGFAELARRWQPILDAFDEQGVDLCYEIHPGEDLHDGVSYERFLAASGNHPRARILFDPSHFVLQQLDYLQFIDIYHERIGMFHVKDAEFNPTGRSGIYGGYQDWIDRPGRFRSLGDGQVDFSGIFSKLSQYGYDGWAVLEWECCIKHPEQGAAEGAPFIRKHLITVTDKAFDDFAGQQTDAALNRKILGL
ncbi:MAG: sugar phosphate isomerase/epimerase [Pseudomonadales bacterium]|nr:sugar phosphate isomerase/epimerase [Pseudomonadales bacterium]